MTALHILSGGAAAGLVRRCTPDFERAYGAQVHGTFGAVGAMKTKLLAGEPCDILILTESMIQDLVAAGQARADTVRSLGVVMTGVAVLAGQPHPDVSNADALRAAFRAASAIYLPDPQLATAGIHCMKVLRDLGLADELAPRLRPHPNGATAMKAMAEAGDPLAMGCTQVTEILITPGVALVDNLPAGFELATVYTAAVTQSSPSSTLALALIEELAAPARAPDRQAAGFRPL